GALFLVETRRARCSYSGTVPRPVMKGGDPPALVTRMCRGPTPIYDVEDGRDRRPLTTVPGGPSPGGARPPRSVCRNPAPPDTVRPVMTRAGDLLQTSNPVSGFR